MNTTEKYIEKLEEYSRTLLHDLNGHNVHPKYLNQYRKELSQLKSEIEEQPQLSAEEVLRKVCRYHENTKMGNWMENFKW